MLEFARKGKNLTLKYRNGPFDVDKLGMLTASDASFAGEFNNRSQQGRIHFLATRSAVT